MASGHASAKQTPARQPNDGKQARSQRNVPVQHKRSLDELQPASKNESAHSVYKRRRVDEPTSNHDDPSRLPPTAPPRDGSDNDNDISNPLSQESRTQTIEDYDEESEEEDFEWEEVDVIGIEKSLEEVLEQATGPRQSPELSITIEETDTSHKESKTRARKPLTAEEKRARLDMHKIHLLCLLFHAYQRNHWCNDEALQHALVKNMRISTKIMQKLFPKDGYTQFQRSRLLKEGLSELAAAWKDGFQFTKIGQFPMKWDFDPAESSEYLESFIDLREFRDKASTRSGSPDYAALLFCALLRGLGFETRLVCSLRPLSFSSSVISSPPRRKVPTIYLMDSEDEEQIKPEEQSSSPAKRRRIARLGTRNRTKAPARSTERSRKRLDSRFISFEPTDISYWSEVFDESYQTWIAVDAVLLGGVIKNPTSMDAAMRGQNNPRAYVIAFEDDNTARDVTRRYAQAYNAKTRKFRVESTERGLAWYKRALRLFRRRRKLVGRDSVVTDQFH